LEVVRERLNLNRPLVTQYWSWLSGVLRGDLGTSLRATVTGVAGQAPSIAGEQGSVNHASVSKLLTDRLGNSVFLVGLASLIAFPLSIVIGAVSAYRRDTLFDHVNSAVSVALAALPEFVIGITLVLIFSTTVFHFLPAVAVLESEVPVWRQTRDLILPVLALVLYEAPYVSRIMRASMIEVLESDYVEMARLKGIPEWSVVTRHALPNAIIPTMHVIAVQLAVLIGGVAVIEVVFGFPGIGLTLVDAVANRDLPVVQAVSLVIAGAYVVINMLADVATILLNPRLRSAFS
jgi:peptide/nickel transport system permease protein